MGIKLKALGLGLLALVAMGAFGVANASAEGGGHFTSDANNTVITGTEEGTAPHKTKLGIEGFKGIECNHALYEGTVEGKTVESITITPTYKECKTESGTAGEVVVHTNECGYTFTIAKKISTVHNTVHIKCKGPKKWYTITHQGCEIRIPEQTVAGIAYNTILISEKHAITVEPTIGTLTVHLEAGFCTLLGTKKTASFTGSVTVAGFEDLGPTVNAPYGTENARVNITATGTI